MKAGAFFFLHGRPHLMLWCAADDDPGVQFRMHGDTVIFRRVSA